MSKEQGLNQLSMKLEEAGLPSSRWWIYRMIKKGKLTLPVKPWTHRFALTDKIISDIVASIMSKGEYHYKEDK